MSTMRTGVGWKQFAACTAFWLAAVPAIVAGQDMLATPTGVAGETKNRLTQERMDELVAGPMSIVERRGLPAGRAAFERLLARTRAARGARSVEAADLLTSFGIGLYNLGLGTGDRRMQEESLPYLEAAIPAYRAAFGAAHPEVALALNSYADAQSELNAENPPQSADAALEEAYRIRLNAFGPSNAETLASLRYLARLRGLPSRTRGDRARIDAVAALYRRLIATSPNDPQMGYLSAPYARTALARMYAGNGMDAEAREQLRLAVEQTASWPAVERCLFTAAETSGVESALTDGAESLLDGLVAQSACFELEDEPAGARPPAPSPEI